MDRIDKRIEKLIEMDGVISISTDKKEMSVEMSAVSAIAEMSDMLKGWTINIVPPADGIIYLII